MSPFTVTATTLPVRIVCFRVSPFTMTVAVASTSVSLAAATQHDVVLPPQLILRDTVRGSVSLTTVLQQQQPQYKMPSQANATYGMGPPQVSFLFQS